jgi:hypothetical protein
MIATHKIPTTLVDSDGQVYGFIDYEGTVRECPPTNVGKEVVAWNEVTGRKEVVGVVVWDGAAPSEWGKGDLMGDYGNVRMVHRKFGGPRFKVATWGQHLEEVNPMVEGADQ